MSVEKKKMWKEAMKVIFLLVVTLLVIGCAQVMSKPKPPLQTVGDTAPPVGCVELRKRGGAC